MINSNPKAVDFLGYKIDSVEDDDGAAYVPLKRLCDILGIDHNLQRRDIKDDGAYDWKMVPVKGADGGHRKMFCLPLKQMHFSVNH